VVVFGALALLFAGTSLSKVLNLPAYRLAATDLTIAVVLYYVTQSLNWSQPWLNETAIVALLLLAAVMTATAGVRLSQNGHAFLLTSLILIAPLIGRFGVLLFHESDLGAALMVSITGALLLYSLLLLLVGAFRASYAWMAAGWSMLLAAVAAYVFTAVGETVHVSLDSLLVVGLMLAALVGLYGRRESEEHPKENLILGAGMLVGLLFTRLGYVVLSLGSPDWEGSVSIIASLLAYSAVTSYVARLLRSRAAALVCTIFALGAAYPYLISLAQGGLPWRVDVAVLFGMLAVTGLASYMLGKGSHDREATVLIPGLAIWGIFSRLVFVLLAHPSIGIDGSAAVTLAWTIYAVILVIVGFRFSMKTLRYLSFVVFGATLGKVMLLDLAALDPGIRVAVLMALGLAMIGGGYWYVRSRQVA
jgi:hypothetical protein